MESAISTLLNWQMLASAVAIMAVMTALKKIVCVFNGGEAVMDKPWFQAAIMTPFPLVLGCLIAFIPKFLAGTYWYQRIIPGICAGLLSGFIYTMLKKRLDPTSVVTTTATVATTVPTATQPATQPVVVAVTEVTKTSSTVVEPVKDIKSELNR